MPYTHSFRPPDARVGKDFEIVKGTDENMARVDEGIGSVTTDDFTIEVGEFVRYMVSQPLANTVYKVDHLTTATNAEIVGVGTTAGETDMPAGIAFDAFNSTGISGVGFPDAYGRGRITVLHGAIIADLKVSHWFVDAANEIENGTACPGVNAGDGANFLTVEAGRRVFIVKPVLTTYGVTRAALATEPIDYLLAFGGGVSAAEFARTTACVGKILRVYTGDDGLQYATVKFKFSGTWV
jgi:hypothetical protein